MESIVQLYLPGAIPLWCALIFGLAALWGYAESMQGRESSLAFARRGYGFFTLSLVLASGVLLISLLRRDFRIEYVFQYTGMDLPANYQLAAFWAGQKGSFLIWLLFGALLGVLLRRTTGKDEGPVMIIYTLTLFGLLFILVRENPFVMLDRTPLDGEGLNPLLQDDWMVIHPPVMFVGYAASAIPFAFAVAAMWRRDTSRWAAKAFPWALFGFLVLGAAILMGGYWAYRTLGWGGYWGWDPVENASLVPWILGTALIHGLHMERTRGRYRRANLVIACLLYISVLYGTFLTRSGVLADFSVHSFVDLGISGWLVALMAFFIGVSLYLLATRLRGVTTRANVDVPLSRGAFMVMATVVLLLSGVVVAVGTSAPLLTSFMESPGQVGPSFYNRVNMPLALMAALLLAVVPFLTWKGLPPGQLLRKLVPGSVVAVLATIYAAWLGVFDPMHLLFIMLSALAAATNLQRTVALTRVGGLGRAGGYLAHVGVGVMFIGFLASSAYDQSGKVTLLQGEPQRLGDLTLTFERFIPRQGREKERMEVSVARDDGLSYNAYPKLFVNDRTRQMMVNPHVQKLWLQDLYISPLQYEPGQPPGVDRRLFLAKGESAEVGELQVRFVDFDLREMGNPQAQLARGGQISVGAALELSRGESSEQLTAFYRFRQDGQVESPQIALAGGGTLAMTGISPNQGRVQIDLTNLGLPPQPAKLSLDVTRKPLIKMVWYGLYIVLAGGLLAGVHRLRQSRMTDSLPAKSS